MNKKLLQRINNALERLQMYNTPCNPDSLRARLNEELDWFDADPARSACLLLLSELTAKLRGAGIVVSPGYDFLTDSFLMYLAGVTAVNPVEWNLPFSRFTMSFRPGKDLVIEAGSGGHEVAAKLLQNRNEFIIENEPGSYEITFLEGNATDAYSLVVLDPKYADLDLDRFKRTVKHGWRPLDPDILRLFRRASTDGTEWFEPDKMRELLFEFEPESMSDLCLLRALFNQGRLKYYPEILRRRNNPEDVVSTGNAQADSILRESYGILVYQEQALLLQAIGFPVEMSFDRLSNKGHEIARVMYSVEAMAMRKHKTSLR